MAIQIVTRSAEVRLVEALNGIGEPAGWQAVHFHLSDLLEQYKSEYQVKIAINLINDLLKDYEGGVFVFVDSSIVVVCYGLEKTVRNKLIFQLRYLYMDDPLAYTEEGNENPDFCTSYDLRSEWQPFMDLCSRRMAAAVRKNTGVRTPAPEAQPQPQIQPVEIDEPRIKKAAPTAATSLAGIERDLTHADLHRTIRRQSVCAMLPDGQVRRVFDELYIHIAHLRQILHAEMDFLSNRWLFKYVTQLLDQRVMDLIRNDPGRYLSQPISLNLNVETLLSSKFAEFDAAMKPSTKVAIVIELPVIDVFADMRAFIAARLEAQRLGYRVCLDGLTSDSFTALDRTRLGLDLVKVQWNADIRSDLTSLENQELVRAVKMIGSNRVILCRCDNKQAVEYGQALGISLFQGRYIDTLINPTGKLDN